MELETNLGRAERDHQENVTGGGLKRRLETREEKGNCRRARFEMEKGLDGRLEKLNCGAGGVAAFCYNTPMKSNPLRMLRALALAGAVSVVMSSKAVTKVACIGDSITYGYGLADRENACYPTQLQKLLDEKFPGKYEVRNFGNSGRGIYLDSMRGNEKRGFRHMKEHQAALAWKPDIVVCNLGINDNGEYIKEYSGGRTRGQFVKEYRTLLADYKKANKAAKFYIWTKLSPLTEGQKFYRSPEPFLMQADLEEVARTCKAVGIDMQEPLREKMDEIFAKDKIHPNAEGARIIAETTFAALTAEKVKPVELPKTKMRQEVWLCAGQSNMQQGWGAYNRTPEEKKRVAEELAQLKKVDVRFWDFNDGSWKKLTPENALAKSANGVSFAIRRAQAIKGMVCILYVAAGGAPTEAFLSEQTMCAVGKDGKPLYPKLCAIATNRHSIDANKDFPCVWCARDYPKRKHNMDEARWWATSSMYDAGIRRIKDLPLTGIYWYQGESNATRNVAPEAPLESDYMEETLRAIVQELRGEKKIPFLMMGLPKMNRPWEPYRAAQKKACEETGAIYLDSFGAGLGETNDVHPRNKIPFAELAAEAAAKALGK